MFKKSVFYLMLCLTLLAACAPVSPPAPANTPVSLPSEAPTQVPPATAVPAQVETSVPPVSESPTQAMVIRDETCPSAIADLKLMANLEGGFCMLYPAEFTWDGARMVVLNPSGMPGDVPGEAWVLVSISEAGGQTAAQIADAQIAEAAGMGMGAEVVRTELTVGGQPAILVDGLPAQDSVRYVYVVNNDRLYRLEFTPWYPQDGTSPLEKLYQVVVDSFRFLP